MSVKRFSATVWGEGVVPAPDGSLTITTTGYLTQCVLATDYDALERERDELKFDADDADRAAAETVVLYDRAMERLRDSQAKCGELRGALERLFNRVCISAPDLVECDNRELWQAIVNALGSPLSASAKAAD